MCPDNPTTKPEPGAVDKMVNEQIGAFVQREIFASQKWAALRRRYPGISERELLKAAVLQAEFIVYLDIKRSPPVVFYEDELARRAAEYDETLARRAAEYNEQFR